VPFQFNWYQNVGPLELSAFCPEVFVQLRWDDWLHVHVILLQEKK